MPRSIASALLIPAIVLAPPTVVTLVRTVWPHTGPAQARAAWTGEPVEPVRLGPENIVKPQDRAVADAAESARQEPSIRSPLAWMGPVATSVAERSAEAPAQAEPAPAFQVTAVMRLHPAPRAVVNGRVRSVGDAVQDGWRVTAINPDAGEVTLERDGRTVRVALRPPDEPR